MTDAEREEQRVAFLRQCAISDFSCSASTIPEDPEDLKRFTANVIAYASALWDAIEATRAEQK